MSSNLLLAAAVTTCAASAFLTSWLMQSDTQEQNSSQRKNLKGKTRQVDQYGRLYHYRPIGTCRTVFANKRGVPRQGSLAPATRGVIKLNTEISPDSLDGLNGFSHVWVIFVFSRNTNHSQVSSYIKQDGKSLFTFPGKVKPPLLLGKRTGLFSTRTPHRPNAIGLTLCKIESVKKRNIEISGVDLCDKTPILDIKPYVPADMVNRPRFPAWLFEREVGDEENTNVSLSKTGLQMEVSYSKESLQQLKMAVAKKRTKFYKSVDQAKEAIDQLLGLDIRGVSQGRGSGEADEKVHQFWVDGMEVEFHIEQGKEKGTDKVHVDRIMPKAWRES